MPNAIEVPIDRDLHGRVKKAAKTEGRTIKGYVANALRIALDGPNDTPQEVEDSLRAILDLVAAEAEAFAEAAQSVAETARSLTVDRRTS